ncbi:MAG: photosynthetic reaction center cytochrome c subunit [Acidobacteriia bacterium]|nr:photosynthetic reaction center cytochrome c subunit [Terriglobia bacterium]
MPTIYFRTMKASRIFPGLTVCFTLTACCAAAQAQPKPVMAEQYFKNVQALKGISVAEFMATMGFISASLGETCTDCHAAESAGNWDRYADDTPRKQTARKMIVMVSAISRTYFGGQRVVTCYSCHRGGDRPKVTPSLAELYGPPPSDEPDAFVSDGPASPTADQVLDKYLAAAGGAERLAALTSFVAKGTYKGFSDPDQRPLEIYAKTAGPNGAERATIVHTPGGDTITTYSSRGAWTAAPALYSPMPVSELSGGDRDGARLDAELAFPARIREALKQWRVGYPAMIDGRAVQLVQASMDGRYPVNLYFDSKSGLLVRQVRYADSKLGLSPTQIDYSDYRDVAGVKMPFRWTVSWLDGRATTELSEVQPNVRIDPAKFDRPKP